jgi:hypothetical protein
VSDDTNPYDPRNVVAVEYTRELLERDRQRLNRMGEALRTRFNIPLDQSIEEYLMPRLRSCEIDEDKQIEDWIMLFDTVLFFDDEFSKETP